jgi:hypothetical protein
MTDVPTMHRALTQNERGAMESALLVAARMASKPLPLGIEQVQRLYNVMLKQAKQDEEEVIALGIAFGAAISERAGFDWVRVTNQWGDETCVGPPRKAIHCAPISMIQKRLKRQEAVDLNELADAVIGSIRSTLADNRTDDW